MVISGFFLQPEGVLGRYAPLSVTVHLRLPLTQTTVDRMSVFLFCLNSYDIKIEKTLVPEVSYKMVWFIFCKKCLLGKRRKKQNQERRKYGANFLKASINQTRLESEANWAKNDFVSVPD